ncbi:MAG: hypothetical protein ABIK44_01875 [candidate division WOR-3 bacterium]
MRRLVALLLLTGILFGLGCGPKDRLAQVKREYPGAAEYRTWKNYVLIRYPVERESGIIPAFILKKEGKRFVQLAESSEGFLTLNEVVLWIPEIDESGVQAFGLR